jgi:monoamine oxidase
VIDDLAQQRANRQIVQGGQSVTSIPFALARAMSWSPWPSQTYRSATIGEPIASTGRMFVAARRRQYRQGASKLMRKTWTASTVGSIGAFANTAPINLRFDRSRADAQW